MFGDNDDLIPQYINYTFLCVVTGLVCNAILMLLMSVNRIISSSISTSKKLLTGYSLTVILSTSSSF